MWLVGGSLESVNECGSMGAILGFPALLPTFSTSPPLFCFLYEGERHEHGK